MLFDELGKMKRSSIMVSIILLALGLIMVVCPTEYINSFVDGLGFALTIFAIVMVLEFINSRKTLMNYILLSGALVVLLVGIAVLVFNNGTADVLIILSWLFGLMLIIDGGHTFLHAIIYARRAKRKHWWVLLILAALLLAFGTVILANLGEHWFRTPKELMQVIGGFMIYSSIVGILRMLWVWPIKAETEG